MYASFDDLEPGRTARSLADNVIAISSLTKCYGLGLQRVGWLLGPPDIVASAEAALLSTCGHLPVAHANIGAQAFAELPRLAAHTKASLGEKRAMARAWTAKVGAHWSDPCEGLFGFCSIPGRGDLRQPIETAAKAGVLVAPGVFFGQPNGFRLSWATTTEAEFAAGLALLETQLF